MQNPGLAPDPDHCALCGGQAKFGRRGVRTFRWYDRYVPGFDPKNPKIVEYLCPCEDQWIAERWLLIRGVPKSNQRLSWIDGDQIPMAVRESAAQYIARSSFNVPSGLGFYLWGDQGTGKTMTSTLMLKALMEAGHDGQFVTFADALNLFRSGWSDADEKAWYAAKIRNAQVLVLDDIGREHMQRRFSKEDQALVSTPTSVAESTLDDLIRHRISNNKPTIITTNLDPEFVKAQYGTNIFSLLAEKSQVCEFKAADWRPAARSRSEVEAELGLKRPVVFS
jgi:DNA replication protein DnaC